MTAIDGALQPVAAQQVATALERLARPTGPDDERSFRQRMADALVHLASGTVPTPNQPRADAPHPAGQAPAASPPTQARVLLLTTGAALCDLDGADPSWLDGHGPVSSATARQICCDAEIRLVTLDGSGQPLDVGRAQRLPNAAQRAAVTARDRGCVGCRAPARACQVHHIRFWARDRGSDRPREPVPAVRVVPHQGAQLRMDGREDRCCQLRSATARYHCVDAEGRTSLTTSLLIGDADIVSTSSSRVQADGTHGRAGWSPFDLRRPTSARSAHGPAPPRLPARVRRRRRRAPARARARSPRRRRSSPRATTTGPAASRACSPASG